jgi:hypothetical protein
MSVVSDVSVPRTSDLQTLFVAVSVEFLQQQRFDFSDSGSSRIILQEVRELLH